MIRFFLRPPRPRAHFEGRWGGNTSDLSTGPQVGPDGVTRVVFPEARESASAIREVAAS